MQGCVACLPARCTARLKALQSAVRQACPHGRGPRSDKRSLPWSRFPRVAAFASPRLLCRLPHPLLPPPLPSSRHRVLLGEVGGTDEYDVCAALADGRITKPLVAWCIGTCAKIFPFEVQFGHAGALANSEAQTAEAKNAALKAAGAIVPSNFNDFVTRIGATFQGLVAQGTIVVASEPPPPKMPMDYAWVSL